MASSPEGSPSPGASSIWRWSPIAVQSVDMHRPRVKSVAVLADNSESYSTDEILYEPIWIPLSPSSNTPLAPVPSVKSVVVAVCKTVDKPETEGSSPCYKTLPDSPNELHFALPCDGEVYIADLPIRQVEATGKSGAATTLSIAVAEQSCLAPETDLLLAPSPSDCPHPSFALQAGITMTGNPLYGSASSPAPSTAGATTAAPAAVPAFLLTMSHQPQITGDDAVRSEAEMPKPETLLVKPSSILMDGETQAEQHSNLPVVEHQTGVTEHRQIAEVAVKPLNHASTKVASKLHGVCKAVPQGGGGGGATKKKRNRKCKGDATQVTEQHTIALSEALQQRSDLLKGKIEAMEKKSQASECGEEEGLCQQEQGSVSVAVGDAEKAKIDAETLAQLSSKLDNLTLCIKTLQKERSVPPSVAPAAPQAADVITDAKGRRFIVFDTCSLIKHPLEAKECIQCLKHQKSDASHSLLVPLEVVRELDGLKSNAVPGIQSAARQAIYLLRAAASQVPAGVFRGQRESELLHGRARRGDSGILDCMLLFRAAGADGLLLVTDDVNLSLRAVTEGFHCVSSSQAVPSLEHSLKQQSQSESRMSSEAPTGPHAIEPNPWESLPTGNVDVPTTAPPPPPPPGLLKVLAPKLPAIFAPPLPLPPINVRHLPAPRIPEQRVRAQAASKSKKKKSYGHIRSQKRRAKKVGTENIVGKSGDGHSTTERADTKKNAHRAAQRIQVIVVPRR